MAWQTDKKIMNYTSYTAIVFTFHHLSAIMAVFLALLLTGIMYWLFIRRKSHRALVFTLAFIVALLIGASIAESIFQRSPFDFEMVSAG